MADPDALGILIRTSRLDKGLSLGQLASAVGRSSSSVRRWERGETAPSADVVSDLAGVLGLDEEELVAMVAAAHPHAMASTPTDASGDDADETPQAPVATQGVRTTIEDEDVVAEVASYFDIPAPVQPPPAQPQPSRYSRVSSAVWGRRDSWIGWLRGFLTLLALFFLFMGLMWALGELLAALKEVLGSFSTSG
jgi:transcriptional regulator with XRE-family HTH domain